VSFQLTGKNGIENGTMKLLVTLLLVSCSAGPLAAQESKAKNVVLFIADGGGVSSLSAASIYGYNKPNGLYVQSTPHLELADTSTASAWIPDGTASATAWATGVKSNNGIVAQSASAFSGVRDGDNLKTILEYAEEKGLSTGVISNDFPTGVASGLVSSFYAHHNDRMKSGQILNQILTPKYGHGIDLVIGTGKSRIVQQQKLDGVDIIAKLKEKFAYVESLDQVAALSDNNSPLVMLTDDIDFSITEATRLAIARLSRNPKGYFLVVFTESHLREPQKDLARIVEIDKAVRETEVGHENDTLSLFTADHGFFLLMRGEHLSENHKSDSGADVLKLISLEDEHTGDAVPLLAIGPGAERVHGYMSNTDVFEVMMSAYGWSK